MLFLQASALLAIAAISFPGLYVFTVEVHDALYPSSLLGDWTILAFGAMPIKRSLMPCVRKPLQICLALQV